MQEFGIKPTKHGLDKLGITAKEAYWNLTPAELVEHTVRLNQGSLADNGAIVCQTGKFTGRAPKDRFIVKDSKTADTVWWGEINKPFDPEKYEQLEEKLIASLADKTLYVRDAYVGADQKYRMNIRAINVNPWQNMFCYNMFLRPTEEELKTQEPHFTIIQNPYFQADPEVDGTRQKNFAIVNFTKRRIIIGGTGYTGEMKKSIFSIMNYLLPQEHNVLAMHCSANIGVEKKDTAVFFGLSGTGKTTLSADPNRPLIGDDEHGWTENSVFNFEGGCYAKVIDLTKEKEPQIWDAIKFGAIVENTNYFPNSRTIDFENSEITENTRVSYPIHHIDNAVEPSVGGVPKNIFFLTCDAYGVLPPISRLNAGQAMYHFISGYTAKVAGTEEGITEPQTAFSACFGAPFLPLHPTRYAEMLGQKMRENEVNVWLVNTGWSGGAHGVGSRMKLPYTRAMITAALNGDLDNVDYQNHPIFGVAVPQVCPEVPSEILNPRATWADKSAYDEQANRLAGFFNKNFEQFADYANDEIMAGAPKVMETSR